MLSTTTTLVVDIDGFDNDSLGTVVVDVAECTTSSPLLRPMLYWITTTEMMERST